MTGNKFVIDSSAWIEYLRGTVKGKKISLLIEDTKNSILTPNIVSVETISKIAREKGDVEGTINAILNLSLPPTESRQDYVNAGLKHARLKKIHKNISMPDAIILTLAEKNNAKIVTLDHHLKGKNTVFLN
ncbi:PIN domain-containing protein [Candidatus Micrarchaeota archaeon]|nr:PIN domain-containing protein [Candidatus Micrarchaeota archaeon]MBU1930570.1 PIN domain-containing protein [Candidatus Micrarchaeota archaeon]